jgi:hypothetical protein
VPRNTLAHSQRRGTARRLAPFFCWHWRTRSLIFPPARGRGRLSCMRDDAQCSAGVARELDRLRLLLEDGLASGPATPDSAADYSELVMLARCSLFLSRALRYMKRKPLQFCMHRLPASFALHLAERRPVLLLRGRRKSVVLLAARHLQALEQTPIRARRALLRKSRRRCPRRVHKPISPVQARKSRLEPTPR